MKEIESIYTSVGYLVYQHRTRKGLSQAKLAKFAGVTRGYICHIETGIKRVQLHQLERIAQVLDIGILNLIPWKFSLRSTNKVRKKRR